MKSQTPPHGGPRLFQVLKKLFQEKRGSDTKHAPAIICAYRQGAVSPAPSMLRWHIITLIFVFMAFVFCKVSHAQQVVITNHNSTAEVMVVYFYRDSIPDMEFRFPVQANSTNVFPLPGDGSSMGVDKEGSSWGYTGGIVAPHAGQTVYLYINGTQTYFQNANNEAFNTGGGSPGGTPNTGTSMDDVILPFAAGFSTIILPLLLWAILNAFRKGASIGNLT